MQQDDALNSFAARLDLVVPSQRQPTLRELYAATASLYRDTKALFTLPAIRESRKTIIVFGNQQFFANDHADIVVRQILDATPSQYLAKVAALALFGCGFAVHELYQDGHVCKHSGRDSHLDCAHSIARKVLETAMALVTHDGADDPRTRLDNMTHAIFVASDHGIAALDRALAEVAGGPLREDSLEILSRETGFAQMRMASDHADLMEMRTTLVPALHERQAMYAQPLLALAQIIVPKLYIVLERRLVEWRGELEPRPINCSESNEA